jgi:hypothetical protein
MNGYTCRSDEKLLGTCVGASIAFRIQMPQQSGRSRSRPLRGLLRLRRFPSRLAWRAGCRPEAHSPQKMATAGRHLVHPSFLGCRTVSKPTREKLSDRWQNRKGMVMFWPCPNSQNYPHQASRMAEPSRLALPLQLPSAAWKAWSCQKIWCGLLKGLRRRGSRMKPAAQLLRASMAR